MQSIKMVDLYGQYFSIRTEVDAAIQKVLTDTDFIQGSAVREFEKNLSDYMGGCHVISCGNGTDALQIAMMALDFRPGDEVILPVHTYVATAEVIALLKLVPVFVDVDEDSYTIDVNKVEALVTSRTVAIVPVHLYGQCANMEPLLEMAHKFKIRVIEDVAQALGAEYMFKDGRRKRAATIGTIGTTSFFPSKNLGAFGDGGAVFTDDVLLAEKIRMISNHGQKRKYHHDLIGVNSRLDTLQAAILNVKLRHLDSYARKRQEVARFYDEALKDIDWLRLPARFDYTTHVFHQYTVMVRNGKRDDLKSFLQKKGIPTMIYYPVPLHLQQAYRKSDVGPGSFPIAERFSESVLSLPVHTEMDGEQLSYICDTVSDFL